MSRRRRNALAPTLFPFLAVLVCTLGTLILLLALVAQEAKTSAQQTAERARSESLQSNRLSANSANELIEEEKFRADHLVSLRDQQTADVERRRDELTHLESELEKLKKQLNNLRDQAAVATESSPDSLDTQTLVLLQEQLAEEERKVAELADAVDSDQPKIVIVPHKGPNGTDRRPIYLECTSKGVQIWPEGTIITPVQLAETAEDANPLDAALRVIRYHAMQHYGDKVAPYPMLVVRPDGTETYAMARAAMRDWDDQFGYELVPADIELAFPHPDSELKKRIEVAVRQAALKQHALVASLRGRGGYGGPFSRSTYSGRPPYGSSSESPRRRLPPTLSAAELDRQGKARGYQPVDRFEGGVFDDRTEFDRMVENLPAQRQTLGDPSGYGESSEFASDRSSTTTNPFGLPSQSDSTDSSSASDPVSGQAANTSITNNPHYARQRLPSELNGPRQGNPRTTTGDPPSITQPWDNSSSTNPQSTPQSANSTSVAGINSPGETSGSTDQYALPYEQRPDSSQRLAQAGDPNQRSSSASSPPPTSTSSNTGRGGSTPRPTMSASASRNPSQSSGQSAASRAAAMNPTPDQNMVRREGRDWAIPLSMAGMRGTTVVRTLQAECHHDRFVLKGSNVSGFVIADQVFPFRDGQVEQATLRFATAIRDRVSGWGTSLPGSRWQPLLKVNIQTHGIQRFHQLRTFMTGSGIEIEGVQP